MRRRGKESRGWPGRKRKRKRRIEMRINRQNGSLTVDDFQELSTASLRSLRDEICAAASSGLREVEIDLSQIGSVDSGGLGALALLYTAASRQRPGAILVIRLLHPQPPVQQLLELARMHQIFEIVPRNVGTAKTHPLASPSAASAKPL